MNHQRIQLTEQEAAQALIDIGLVVGSYDGPRQVKLEDRDYQGNRFTTESAIKHAQYQLGKHGVNHVVVFKPCSEITEGKNES